MLKFYSKKYLYILITIFWLITMTTLIMKHYVPEGLQRISFTSPLPDELFEKQWMGVYLNGEKIGYSYRKITELEYGYMISEKMKVKLQVMENEKEVVTILNVKADSLFRLLSFTFRLISDTNIDVSGRMEGKTLLVSVKTGAVTSRKKIHISDPPYVHLSLVPYIMKKGLNTGSIITIPVINPIDMSQEYVKVKVIGKDSIMSMGKKKQAYKLKGTFKGFETTMWITKKGEVLREDSHLGFSLIKETEETAVQLAKPSIDVVAQVAIPFNLSLPFDEIKYLKVRLSGVSLKELEVDGGRQRLNGDILEIKKESLVSYSLQSSKNMDEYLKDTMFIQSSHHAIISKTKEIVGDEEDLLKITKLIHEWVYKNIKKVAMITMPIATEVLNMRRGDCNEHTVLFTALARAAGIPARIAVGLTYRDGFFYYHAWPEVYLDGWIAVDPTLGQFPADASHIRLLTGDIDRQLQLLSIIGKLKLEGIEFRG